MSLPPAKPVHPLERKPEPVAPARPATVPPIAPVPRVRIPTRRAVLSYVLMGLNIAVFLADALTGGLLTALGAKDNAAILQGELWRFVTPMFLHGGLVHILANSYALYILGPRIEETFGRPRFTAIYLLSGLGASLASFVFNPNPAIGASGAIFGLMGALIPFLYLNRGVLANTRGQLTGIAQLIALNLVIGLSPGIDNWAHVGGLVTGLALAWLITPRYVVRVSPDQMQIRVEDQSGMAQIWGSIGAIAIVIGAAALGLILIRGG